MMYFVVFVIAVIIGVATPGWLGLFLFVADCFLPDPFPFVDEVGLAVGLIMKAKS